MGSLDLAGVIGTWMAAGIAIIALAGIIGPILIWRASRTERHQALAGVRNSDCDFITKGLHVGPNIWLWQRIKAPLLDKAPTIIDQSFVLNVATTKFDLSQEQAGWVNLGHLLQGYGVVYPQGDNLYIQHTRAYLPLV